MIKDIICEASRLTKANEDFVLASVISRDGSAPRGPGAKMLVRRDGSITGTIGGGLVEAEVIKSSVEMISARSSVVRRFIFAADIPAGIDMSCGGEAVVLIQYVDSNNPENASMLSSAEDVFVNPDTHKQTLFVTEVNFDEPLKGEAISTEANVQCYLYSVDAERYERKKPFDELLKQACTSSSDYKSFFPDKRSILVCEALGKPNRVYVCGGGHVGLKTAEAVHAAGFETVVMDDRPEFASVERFPSAREVRVVPDYSDLFSSCIIDERSYVVIVTRGHSYDQKVLRQALETEAKYIGMMGSRNKIKKVFDSLKAEGITDAQLERVYAPIGLAIGAETPAEIAVSITAELIKVKSGK